MQVKKVILFTIVGANKRAKKIQQEYSNNKKSFKIPVAKISVKNQKQKLSTSEVKKIYVENIKS